MQVKFYLNTQKVTRHGDRPVYMYITFEGKRIRKPVSGVHAKEKSWDELKGRIRRPPRANPFNEIESFNNRLDFIETQIKLINQRAFDRRTRLTEKYILDRLNDEELIKSDRYDFFSIADQYIETIKPIKAERTVRGKITVFNFLKGFQKLTTHEISFQHIDLEFYEALRKFAFERKKIGDNYFAKIIAVLKTFLNWAFERDYLHDQVFKKFKAAERETEIICLTHEEFLALYNYPFKSSRLSHIRDVFIFGCSTGLRFSDLITLQPSNIQGEFIVKNIQKTQENCMIPLNKYSKEILLRYEKTAHQVLPRVSHQKFNQYIKECCKEVGIDTPTTITRFSGAKRKHTVYPKYERITSHTARKTFTTLSLLMGVPERVVKNITGHKKEENFRKYVNFTKEFEKQQINSVWDKI